MKLIKLLATLALGLSVLPCTSFGRQWPDRPIHIVVPFSAGGSTDVVARIISAKLTERLGQSVVVDNKTGAGGTIGSDYVVKSPPDGYTLLVGTSSTIAIAPYIYGKLPYDPRRDLLPVSLLGVADILVAVNPKKVPARNLAQLIQYAKDHPGKLTFASGGVGTISHLLGEYFKAAAHIDMLHVPYKGDTPALTDLIAGRVDMEFGTSVAFLPALKTGQLIALAVTSAQRSKNMPQLPTVAESGVPGYEAVQWFGILAPARTPPAVLQRLNTELQAILQMPDVQAQFAKLGFEIAGGSPQKFAQFLQAEDKKWKQIVKLSGARLD